MLLPSLVRQPGQLHFITGLKNDIFGISCSNSGTNFIYSIAEGHWTGGKTANETCSMVFAALRDVKSKVDVIHCDNCAVQFKNRFFIWFCCWLQKWGLFKEAQLNFLIPGHTKNQCDGAFGCAKKKMKSRNIATCDQWKLETKQSSRSLARLERLSWISIQAFS